MKTVLVTGASGYIGSHVCYELVQNGFIVDGIDVADSENTRELVKHLRNYWRRDIGNANIKGAYDVVVSSKLLSQFTNTKYNLTYYIALEPDSTFG